MDLSQLQAVKASWTSQIRKSQVTVVHLAKNVVL